MKNKIIAIGLVGLVCVALFAFELLEISGPRALAPNMLGELDLYGYQLGETIPENTKCYGYPANRNCNFESSSGQAFSTSQCDIPLSAENSQLGIEATACISPLSRRIGRLNVDVPSFSDSHREAMHMAVLTAINAKFNNEGEIEYRGPGLGIGLVYFLERRSGEFIGAIRNIPLLRLFIELGSPAATQMIYEEDMEIKLGVKDRTHQEADKKSKDLKLGI